MFHHRSCDFVSGDTANRPHEEFEHSEIHKVTKKEENDGNRDDSRAGNNSFNHKSLHFSETSVAFGIIY